MWRIAAYAAGGLIPTYPGSRGSERGRRRARGGLRSVATSPSAGGSWGWSSGLGELQRGRPRGQQTPTTPPVHSRRGSPPEARRSAEGVLQSQPRRASRAPQAAAPRPGSAPTGPRPGRLPAHRLQEANASSSAHASRSLSRSRAILPASPPARGSSPCRARSESGRGFPTRCAALRGSRRSGPSGKRRAVPRVYKSGGADVTGARQPLSSPARPPPPERN